MLFLTRAAASSLVGRENKRVFILSSYFSWRNPAISNCIRHTEFRDELSFANRLEVAKEIYTVRNNESYNDNSTGFHIAKIVLRKPQANFFRTASEMR